MPNGFHGSGGGSPKPRQGSRNKTALFAIIGALLGIPLSYYFQPEVVRTKLGLSEYVTKLPEVMGEGADYVIPVLLSVVIFGFALGIVGYALDRQAQAREITGTPEQRHNPPESEA